MKLQEALNLFEVTLKVNFEILRIHIISYTFVAILTNILIILGLTEQFVTLGSMSLKFYYTNKRDSGCGASADLNNRIKSVFVCGMCDTV